MRRQTSPGRRGLFTSNYLAALVGGAFLLGMFRVVAIDPTALAFSAVLIIAACWLSNRVFARIFGAIPNLESMFITALILVLILDPVSAHDLRGVGVLLFASVWAMASKFILSVRRRHVFNPAALGVALPGLLLDASATWWISAIMWLLPIVVVGGALVVRKLRRFDLILASGLANIAVTLLTSAPDEFLSQLQFTVLHSPFFFFAFVMLTEPLTAPQQRLWRLVYGALVGVLASPNIAIVGYYFTPEVALLAGNLVTLPVSPAGRVKLTLERIEKAADGVFDFIFQPSHRLAFNAGQYLGRRHIVHPQHAPPFALNGEQHTPVCASLVRCRGLQIAGRAPSRMRKLSPWIATLATSNICIGVLAGPTSMVRRASPSRRTF